MESCNVWPQCFFSKEDCRIQLHYLKAWQLIAKAGIGFVCLQSSAHETYVFSNEATQAVPEQRHRNPSSLEVGILEKLQNHVEPTKACEMMVTDPLICLKPF